jgi:anti-sigma factor RsiW
MKFRRLFGRFRRHDQMMCADVVRVLQQYLDGRLDAATARLAAQHLEMCKDCGLEAETYATIKRALFELGAPPPDAIERLRTFAVALAEGHAG